MTNLHRERLEKLAEHLETGTLGHEVFDIRVLNVGLDRKRANGCGFAGCAIGELPVIFPGEWEFNQFGIPRLISGDTSMMGAQFFFGISSQDSARMFVASSLRWVNHPACILSVDATRYDVAAGIRAFLAESAA